MHLQENPLGCVWVDILDLIWVERFDLGNDFKHEFQMTSKQVKESEIRQSNCIHVEFSYTFS